MFDVEVRRKETIFGLLHFTEKNKGRRNAARFAVDLSRATLDTDSQGNKTSIRIYYNLENTLKVQVTSARRDERHSSCIASTQPSKYGAAAVAPIASANPSPAIHLLSGRCSSASTSLSTSAI